MELWKMLPGSQPLCYFFHDQQVMLRRRSDPNAALDLPELPPYIDPIIPHHLVSLSMPSSRYFRFPSTFLAICSSRVALNYLIYYCQEWKAQSDGTCGHTVHTLPTRLWKARERWTLTVHPGDNGYWTWPHCLIFFYAKTIISLYIMLSISIF